MTGQYLSIEARPQSYLPSLLHSAYTHSGTWYSGRGPGELDSARGPGELEQLTTCSRLGNRPTERQVGKKFWCTAKMMLNGRQIKIVA